MKPCPACGSKLEDNAVGCAVCGGSYQPDGSFQTQWDIDMARMAVERERKVTKAEKFGKWGKPHTTMFLEKEGGCALSLVGLAVVCAAAAFAVLRL